VYEVMVEWETVPTSADQVRLSLELLNERSFGNGVVYMHYSTRH
jgi:hypothetical protein